MKYFGEIYLITNILNEKAYVGQTKNGVEFRWSQHLMRTKRRNDALASAIRKYGASAFDRQSLATASSQSELDNLEKVWIILLQTRAPQGYNLTSGGNVGTRRNPPTLETLARMSASHKGHRPSKESNAKRSMTLKGRVITSAHRAKISEALTGQVIPPEARAKMSAAKKGRSAHNKGIPMTDQQKVKLSNSKKGKPWSAAQRAAYEARKASKTTS
jgi:group I intron endonuclease